MISADLGLQLESFVAKLVETGRYNSKSEVLREGIRLIQEREAKLDALDLAIARGLEDAPAGRTKPAEAVFDRLDAKYRALGGTSKWSFRSRRKPKPILNRSGISSHRQIRYAR